jgi:gas vesicle structural protein
MAVATTQNRYAGGPSPSGLADVLDLILDKGLVIDLYLRVSLVGIELLTVDARIVVASVDTYLRFAEAVGRLNIDQDGKEGLPELMESMTSGAAKSKTSGALDAAKEKLGDLFDGDDDEEDRDERNGRREKERVPARRQRARRKRPVGDDDE